MKEQYSEGEVKDGARRLVDKAKTIDYVFDYLRAEVIDSLAHRQTDNDMRIRLVDQLHLINAVQANIYALGGGEAQLDLGIEE